MWFEPQLPPWMHAASSNDAIAGCRAPEVCSSSPYTSQADMWSLGCVLYELCTLQHAFSADSLYALIFRIINGSYEQIDHTRYSSSLSSLVAALLDKDPVCRPSCRSLLKSEYVQMHIEKTMNKVIARFYFAIGCACLCITGSGCRSTSTICLLRLAQHVPPYSLCPSDGPVMSMSIAY